MKARSFAMVMMSRTVGTLCSVTASGVSSAAAIRGRAEFFAPPIVTLPGSGFPPQILNLSIRDFPKRSSSLFLQRPPQASFRVVQAAARLRCGGSSLEHHQGDPQIVVALTQW